MSLACPIRCASSTKHASPSRQRPSKATHLVRGKPSVTSTGPRTQHAYWRVCANNHCKVAGCRSHRPEPLVRLGDSLSPVHPRKWNTQRRFQTAAGSNACEPLAADPMRQGQQTIPLCEVSAGQQDSLQARLLSLGGLATAPPSAGGSGAVRPAFHTRL